MTGSPPLPPAATREEQAAAVAADPDSWAATLLPLARSVAKRLAPLRLRDEVAAACWLAALVAARAFDPAKGIAPYRWVRVAAVTAARDYLRKLRRAGLTGGHWTYTPPPPVGAMGEADPGDTATSPTAAVDAADWWAVRSRWLDSRVRRAVWLRLAEGRTVAEVAAELDVSVTQALRLVAEGRAKLRGVA